MKNIWQIGRKPDFVLKALNKDTDAKAKVGAAWNNPDGSISVELNAFVVIPASRGLVLTLFPEGQKAAKIDP